MGSLIRPVGGRWRIDGAGPVLAGVFVVAGADHGSAGSLPALPWALAVLVVMIAVMGFGNGVIFQIVSGWFPREIGLASGLVGAGRRDWRVSGTDRIRPLREGNGTFVFGFVCLAAASGLRR